MKTKEAECLSWDRRGGAAAAAPGWLVTHPVENRTLKREAY